MSAKSTRRKFFRSCLCCEPSSLPASPARRTFLAGGAAALGLGDAAGHRPDHDASRRATGPCPTADRRASPFHPAVPRRFHDGARTPRGSAPAEMVAGALARGHGQERDRDLDPVDRAARHLVWKQCRGIPQPGAPAQRVRRQDRKGPSRPLRPLCRDCAAGRRRKSQGDRIRLRYPQGRRHRAADQLPGQVSWRSLLCAGLRGAQPAQGGDLCPSDHARLLPRPRTRHPAGIDRIRDRLHPHDRAPGVQRHCHEVSGHPLDLLP